ncbi:hypothetical protein [Cryobacterium sp. Y50]|uniref:hypothetical protein n=1 Tax=Cryobacterium sp. Y50 TaxID=2048286 RepID=UPI0011B036DE|nr:hypothetical protein [Cryobacterium sp. Y50]
MAGALASVTFVASVGQLVISQGKRLEPRLDFAAKPAAPALPNKGREDIFPKSFVSVLEAITRDVQARTQKVAGKADELIVERYAIDLNRVVPDSSVVARSSSGLDLAPETAAALNSFTFERNTDVRSAYMHTEHAVDAAEHEQSAA